MDDVYPRKRLMPNWYLITILCLLAFGFISNYIVTYTFNYTLLWIFNHINLTITIAWIMLNAYLLILFIRKNYESKALFLPIYFLLINLFNVFNFLFQFYSNYAVLFWVSLGTKIVELAAVAFFLIRNRKVRKRIREYEEEHPAEIYSTY
ncbi:MAG: hypothetical protein ACOCWQ_05340 [Nanoarchaeota archaeon]